MRPYPVTGFLLAIVQDNGLHFASFITFFLALSFFSFAANAQCHRNSAYDASEIANSAFFSTREQTKFAPGERHYPLASHATARYCFSRGCAGQLTVKWTDEEQIRLHYLRASMVQAQDPSSELRFIKVATLQMETWLYARLQSLYSWTVIGIMKRLPVIMVDRVPKMRLGLPARWVPTTVLIKNVPLMRWRQRSIYSCWQIWA